MCLKLKVAITFMLLGSAIVHSEQESIARIWNEELLDAIRIDYPAPTVHSRNLFHLSAAMYDAWRVYDSGPELAYLVDLKKEAANPEAARREAISYAAYRLLSQRFTHSPGGIVSQAAFDARMTELGYDISYIESGTDNPAAIGNLIAQSYLQHFLEDGSNEANHYSDNSGYASVNPPMVLSFPGTNIEYPNHWQPLAFNHLVLQNGIVVGASTQEFLGSHWGNVQPFALNRETAYNVYEDPGPPPLLGGRQDLAFRDSIVEVIEFSSILDPDQDILIDISPASIGNNPLGTNAGSGYAVNPFTGAAYAPSIVRLGDYGRILAEFWADGPDSETPPGHWNTLANYVSDHPLFEKRIAGKGEIIDDLEWEIKLYFALNGALHDAAIAAWDAKEAYDYVRPISAIRYMGGLGQSSDPLGISYHPDGLPLIPGLIEVINFDTMGTGQRHEHLAGYYGDIAIRSWTGQVEDPEASYGGVGWIRASDWFPYQRETFVTPPFAGFVSGHSTFSRAGAEVLAAFTGDPFFPGGMGSFTAHKNEYLEFEAGPTETIELQWATYYDAADEAGISRLYGGIHVTADDLEGRKVGARIGKAAHALAQQYFNGLVILDHPKSHYVAPGNNTVLSVIAAGNSLSYDWFQDGRLLVQTSQPFLVTEVIEDLTRFHVIVRGNGGQVASHSCHVSPTVFHSAVNLGKGNKLSSWLGHFNDLHFPMIWHAGQGWFHSRFEDDSGGWFYRFDLGWCWTSERSFPFLFAAETQQWVYSRLDAGEG